MKLKELFMTKALIDAMMYNELLFDDPVQTAVQYYSTIGTALKINNTAVVGLTSYGDIGGSPNQLETTTLADASQTFIEGVQQQSQWECGIRYNPTYGDTIWALNNESPKTNKALELTFANGEKYTNQGQVSFRLDGKGVDEVVEGTITITLAGKWTRTYTAPTP